MYAQSVGSAVRTVGGLSGQAQIAPAAVRAHSLVWAVLTFGKVGGVCTDGMGSHACTVGGVCSAHTLGRVRSEHTDGMGSGACTDGGFGGVSRVGGAGRVHKVNEVHRVPTVHGFRTVHTVCGDVGGQSR